MRKQLYLHLGFHRNATSKIQAKIARDKDEVLREFHVVNQVAQETRRLRAAINRYGGDGRLKGLNAVAAECAKIAQHFEASRKQKLLLSDEALLGPMLRQAGESGLYTNLERHMAALIECFSSYDLHFLFYVREPQLWLRSLYGQAVKQAYFAGSFEAYLDGVDIQDIWGRLEKRVGTAAQGRQVRFFKLEDEIDSPFGTGDALFKYIGLTEEERGRMIEPPTASSSNWPEPALNIMRILNASPTDDGSLKIVRNDQASAKTKQLYFHLGFHKTATTYIQVMIARNQDGVLRKFHVLNRVGLNTRSLQGAITRFGKGAKLRGLTATLAECAEIVENFEASGKQKLLLSDETLLGPMLRQAGEAGLYTNLERHMAALIECFSAYELHFLFYIRRPRPWLRSLYNQAVKQARFAGSFKQYLDGVDTQNIWGKLEKRVNAAAQGRQVRFFKLEDEKDSPFGAGVSLFKYIGLDDEERGGMVMPPAGINSSWPESSLTFMRNLNASQIDDPSLDIVRTLVKRRRNLFR